MAEWIEDRDKVVQDLKPLASRFGEAILQGEDEANAALIEIDFASLTMADTYFGGDLDRSKLIIAGVIQECMSDDIQRLSDFEREEELRRMSNGK